MPIFDYKGADGRALIADALRLAVFYSTGEAPAGWRKIEAAELGISDDKLDEQGQFTGDGTVDGQALVLGRFDDAGRLVQLSIAFTATNGADAPDYSKMDDDTYANAFDYMIEAVRVYGGDAGLTGSDVIVTGYSLGAGAANTMAAQRDTSWGGYYADSDYLAFAVPKVTEIDDVFNFGFENDVVHRVVGEGDKDANAASPIHGVEHNDGPYETTTDNLVLFNDTYANPLFPTAPFVLANLPEGWSAHIDMPDADPIGRIGRSSWYDHIEKDSTVVLSWLTEQLRPVTWVEDKNVSTSNHFGSLAFLIGDEGVDRLRDGTADDFIDGYGGDDAARLSAGNDQFNGGAGLDLALVAGGVAAKQAFRLADGTLYLFDRDGVGGLDALTGVERVGDEGLLGTTWSVRGGALRVVDGPGADIGYGRHWEGGAGGDFRRGNRRDDALFGRDGDDRLAGSDGRDLLAGERGNDTLAGEGGDDVLVGGAGDDVLAGGLGDDRLSGGVGSDTFDFRTLAGDDVVIDFDAGEQGKDVLRFLRADFASVDAILAAAREVDGSVVIDGANGSVTLAGVALADLGRDDLSLTGRAADFAF